MSHRPSVALRIACVLAVAAPCACSRNTPSAATPTPPAVHESHIDVTLRVYNSALGEITAAARTISAALPTGATLQIVLPIPDLQATGVDPLRAAVYEAHAGAQLGQFVASTKDGTIRFTVQTSGTYDVFLMSTASGVDYTKADAQIVGTEQPVARYATMRRARAGEPVLGQIAVDETDDSFRFAAEQFTAALNPFGLQYGQISFVGNAVTADITAAWVTPTQYPCWGSNTGPGVFWTNPLTALTSDQYPYVGGGCWPLQVYVTRIFGGALVIDALGRVYIGTGACLLIRCPESNVQFLIDRKPPFTATGIDVARYAALMNGSLK